MAPGSTQAANPRGFSVKRIITVLATLLPISAAVIPELRNKLSAGDLTSADAIVDQYFRASGANSEYAAAVSWLARGALMLGDNDAASRYLAKTKGLIADLLKTSNVENDSFLSTAVGASIEVEARMLANQGLRDKAVALLEAELARSKTWSLRFRIQKNINLLTLVGKFFVLSLGDAGEKHHRNRYRFNHCYCLTHKTEYALNKSKGGCEAENIISKGWH